MKTRSPPSTTIPQALAGALKIFGDIPEVKRRAKWSGADEAGVGSERHGIRVRSHSVLRSRIDAEQKKKCHGIMASLCAPERNTGKLFISGFKKGFQNHLLQGPALRY